MPTVRGCNLPEELLYDVENHIWFTETGNGNVRIGMTTIATAMATGERPSSAAVTTIATTIAAILQYVFGSVQSN